MRKVVSFGGGVNGVAMLISMVRSGDRPDAILFADTGGERPETYEYISYFSEWLALRDFPPITTVTYKTKRGRRITLEQEVLKAKTLPSVAFGFKTCSQKHKIFPQHKFTNYHWGRESVTWYVGFDAGEARRVKANPNPHHQNKYPLIDLGWTRSECINQIKAEGVRVPVKSSCFFCPNLKKAEILALSEDLQQRAVAMEDNAAPTLTSAKGLGRRFAWKDLIAGNANDNNEETFKRLTGEDLEPIVCECID